MIISSSHPSLRPAASRQHEPRLSRSDLRADCGSCVALCCTAFGFSRSADFAEDKPAGSPCRHLDTDHSCTVHSSLRARGFRGCDVFDCFGAGQRVSQGMFAGVGGRDRPGTRERMFSAFAAAKLVHEMAWHLIEARERTYDPETAREADALAGFLATLTHGTPDELLSVDLDALHDTVRAVLVGVSAEVRGSYFADADAPDAWLCPGADLAGRDLRQSRLCGADLRGAVLIAADLRGCDLAAADLLGADLRDARLAGADLSSALYLTRSQVTAADGSASTRLPSVLETPSHWQTR